MNGAGKSNLLNAITWCLYGKEHHKIAKYTGLPIINTVTQKEMDIGEISEVKVQLKMSENGNLIIIRRKFKFKKINNNEIKVLNYPESGSDGSKFEICKLEGNDWVTSNDPIFTLNKLIPEDILEYFFFDGEQLNYYFKDKSGEKIKDAVFQISQLAILERLINHLKNRRNKF